MPFLHPILALAGLGAVALPILIHLLMRRRRRPVRFGAMRFLQEAYRKQRRRLQVERWLLLAARCLLVALLAAAIARPLVAGAPGARRGPVWVTLVIDNSLASRALGPDGSPRLEAFRARALALLATLDPAAGDRVGLFAAGGPPEALVVPESADLESVAAAVRALASTDSRADLPAAAERLRSQFEGEPTPPGTTRSVVALSDWRAGSFDPADRRVALPAGVSLRATPPAAEAIGNTALARVEPLRRVLIAPREGVEESVPVRVALVRSGSAADAPGATRIRLRARGIDQSEWMDAGEGQARWARGQREQFATITARVRPPRPGDPVLLEAIIAEAPDAIGADDTARAVLATRRQITAAVLAQRPTRTRQTIESLRSADWLALSLDPDNRSDRGDASIRVTFAPPAGAGGAPIAWSSLDVVAAPEPASLSQEEWAQLAAFAAAGGLVIVTPDADAAPERWWDALAAAFQPPWELAGVKENPGGAALRRPGGASEPNRILSMLAGEFEQLGAGVRVRRWVGVRAPRESVLLDLDSGDPLALAHPVGGATGGTLIFLSAATRPDWTDLPAKPLMVPLMQEIVRQGVGREQEGATLAAGLAPTPPEGAVERRPLDGAPAPPRPDEPARLAGFSAWIDARGRTRGVLAVNPDARAGLADAADPLAVAGALAPPSEDQAAAAVGEEVIWIDESVGASELSRARGEGPARDAPERWSLWLLAAAAAVALAEVVLARRASHAALSAEPLPGGAA